MFKLGDIIEMKKPHACGTNRWEVTRMGMDIKARCLGCGHVVMMPRRDFQKRLKKVLVPAEKVALSAEPNYVDPKQQPHF
ncbi:hypothetical protein IV38_GL002047 [Lactobacillus selangorensis]|uniref:DUF951 domain-containing protein n=1 Tax=Lactobacillus selangorensis TaxID=81857 RepID=A0A0R2FQF2_9LACO|nr:DUF951 domain-containing protein [Lactobacillus selangorensis]KRN27591.1 hypothetical protein IV38_GL002047 [Lactobacillus selangorensis]KRN30136.1 hypothetical protein IV40_GL001982 [Lactobacillus selangorensis]